MILFDWILIVIYIPVGFDIIYEEKFIHYYRRSNGSNFR